MRFSEPLTPARLIRRYKRFLADVETEDGSRFTVHCPNTGAMLGCDRPGSPVWLSRSDRPGRKYPWTLEVVDSDGIPVGVHTGRTNALAAEAVEAGLVPGLTPSGELRQEVTLAGSRRRVDLVVPTGAGDVYVEVKSVTASKEPGVALFPDAVSARASAHLEELGNLSEAGSRSMLLFVAQRGDVDRVRAAGEIDRAFADGLIRARERGVSLAAVGAEVSPEAILLRRPLEILLP